MEPRGRTTTTVGLRPLTLMSLIMALVASAAGACPSSYMVTDSPGLLTALTTLTTGRCAGSISLVGGTTYVLSTQASIIDGTAITIVTANHSAPPAQIITATTTPAFLVGPAGSLTLSNLILTSNAIGQSALEVSSGAAVSLSSVRLSGYQGLPNSEPVVGIAPAAVFVADNCTVYNNTLGEGSVPFCHIVEPLLSRDLQHGRHEDDDCSVCSHHTSGKQALRQSKTEYDSLYLCRISWDIRAVCRIWGVLDNGLGSDLPHRERGL
jgi:hypothetical protein